MLRIFLDRLGEHFPLVNILVENSDILYGERKGTLASAKADSAYSMENYG